MIVRSIMKKYRDFRLKLLTAKILRNWDLKTRTKLIREDLFIIKEIFFDKIYALYFPFHRINNIIDIGAHKGFFALFAAKLSDRKSKIICVEPSPVNYAILMQNIQVNGLENIIGLNKGLAAREGKGILYTYSDANNSVLENYGAIIQKATDSMEQIELISLAQIIQMYKFEQIDFLKMDCEGCEYEILYNLDTAIYKKIAVISLEFHDLNNEDQTGTALVHFLRHKGFIIADFYYIEAITNILTGHIVAINNKISLY